MNEDLANHADKHILYEVIPDLAFDMLLTYRAPLCASFVSEGSLVIVPVRNRATLGVIVSCNLKAHALPQDKADKKFDIKPIQSVLPYTFTPSFLDFIQQAAKYTLIPVGHLLGMCLIHDKSIQQSEKEGSIPSLSSYNTFAKTLNEQQNKAAMAVIAHLSSFKAFLLDGVTGSGKTEVYFAILNAVLAQGKKALILLPEIALTEAIVKRFEATFGRPPFVWHSHITPARKRKMWKTLMQPGPAVILGARSALFIPMPDVGIIVVDEEHDTSYKQEEQGIYNARDLSVLRAKCHNCPVVLASATPSLETFAHVLSGKYGHLVLENRFADACLPKIEIINRQAFPRQLITPPLKHAIMENLAKGEQTLLFLNRRGFSPLLICFGCGYRFECPGCHVELTVHKENQMALCHYCGYGIPEPKVCPSCANTQIKDLGWGVEKVEQEVIKMFPNARVMRMSSDTLTNEAESKRLFEAIANHDVDLIVGTQVLAKGHHFPQLTCVGILDADKGLSQMDLRAGEKTYQLLTQVAGRAGRMADRKGSVWIQTNDPDNPLYDALKRYDRDAFYHIELCEREAAMMPPFTRLVGIILSSLREDLLLEACRTLARAIPSTVDAEVLGPTPAPLYRIRSRYRMRFLARSDKTKNLQGYVKKWLSSVRLGAHIHVQVDVDPFNFL